MAELQNVHGHQAEGSARRAAKADPIMLPAGAVAPKTAKAIFFRRPGSYNSASNARLLGRAIDGPMPMS
ncbi:hypothetical protein Tdes44962_MAKER03878 [Teratosphaeria destructans]|uniref:Uncharacterized protein n=1 Tax=Teratosphaeria destructans TaxID=418781 RepID=A0A9W7W155_9PEZI|nr:hypothetical protein Tdes44962_MAKER03878 [Teratosphaeria destructans]